MLPPSARPIAVAVAFAATAGSALAQPQPAPPDYAAAKLHYQAAEEAAAQGDHATAAREFGIAYDITRDAVLFYRIGQSYDRAGDCTSAQVYYGRYLRDGKPSEEFKQKTEAAMKACAEKQAGTGAGAGAAAGAGTGAGAGAGTGAGAGAGTGAGAGAGTGAGAGADGETVGTVIAPARSLIDEEPTWQRTAAWTSVGIGIALLTTGAVLGLSAASREEDVANLIEFRDPEGRPATYTGATRERYDDLIEEGERLESLAIVAFAASGVAAASAVLFFVIDPGSSGADPRLRATASPDGAGVSWSGRF